MTTMIIYATVEGQTGKIARYIADVLQTTGTQVLVVDAEKSEPLEFNGIDAVILAAPVHERRHPRRFEALVGAYRRDLEALPTLLLSVSLSAAFEQGLDDAQDFLTEMEMRTHFKPTADACVAGAIKTSKYDYFATQIVRYVVLRDKDFDASAEEHEFTDWPALAKTVTAFLASHEAKPEATSGAENS